MPDNNENTIKFLNYFNKQWLIGKIQPTIWNHNQSFKKRTNNNLEAYHSILKKVFSNCHSSLSQMVKFIKSEDHLCRDQYLKQNFKNKRYELSKKEADKDLEIEFHNGCIDFEEYFNKLSYKMMRPFEFGAELNNEENNDEDNDIKENNKKEKNEYEKIKR